MLQSICSVKWTSALRTARACFASKQFLEEGEEREKEKRATRRRQSREGERGTKKKQKKKEIRRQKTGSCMYIHIHTYVAVKTQTNMQADSRGTFSVNILPHARETELASRYAISGEEGRGGGRRKR